MNFRLVVRWKYPCSSPTKKLYNVLQSFVLLVRLNIFFTMVCRKFLSVSDNSTSSRRLGWPNSRYACKHPCTVLKSWLIHRRLSKNTPTWFLFSNPTWLQTVFPNKEQQRAARSIRVLCNQFDSKKKKVLIKYEILILKKTNKLHLHTSIVLRFLTGQTSLRSTTRTQRIHEVGAWLSFPAWMDD